MMILGQFRHAESVYRDPTSTGRALVEALCVYVHAPTEIVELGHVVYVVLHPSK